MIHPWPLLLLPHLARSSSSGGNKVDTRADIEVPNKRSCLGNDGCSAPRRETREGQHWNLLRDKGPVGTTFIKHFAEHGLFEGRIEQYEYPFATVRYEDGDVEDLEPRKALSQ